MFRKILPFIMGIVPLASLADTNPPTLLPTNTGVLIDGGNSFTYTVTGDAVINGDFVVDATADSVNSTIVDTDGAFITNTNNGNGNVSNAAGNAAGGGLTINAVNGITVAGLISNSGGTLVLNPGDGATISAAGISS
ncbi:MAG: hypothetical protein FWG18_01810, partial [Alphaproteobacteria bacterium]|nr:hypothetical protein [Alphaproteobacteria bacterium]